MRGQRGRLIVEADRQRAIELIEEAVTAGARRFRACQILQIDVRTLQRWKQALKRSVLCDQRKVAAQARTPGNALTLTEREEIGRLCIRPECSSLRCLSTKTTVTSQYQATPSSGSHSHSMVAGGLLEIS